MTADELFLIPVETDAANGTYKGATRYHWVEDGVAYFCWVLASGNRTLIREEIVIHEIEE